MKKSAKINKGKSVLMALMLMIMLVNLFSCKNELSVSSSNDLNVNAMNEDNEVYDLEEGDKMPNIKVELNNGKVFELEKTEKPALINFWATWCPPCKIEMPGLQNLYKEYGNKVDFVMINLAETKDTIKDFLSQNSIYTFPIGYDVSGSFGEKFSIVGIPTTYIVGKDKIVKNCVVGARDEAQFKDYLEKVINE